MSPFFSSLADRLSCARRVLNLQNLLMSVAVLAIVAAVSGRVSQPQPLAAPTITVTVVGNTLSALTGRVGENKGKSYSLDVQGGLTEGSECTVWDGGQVGPWSAPSYSWSLSGGDQEGIHAALDGTSSSTTTVNVDFLIPGEYTLELTGSVNYHSSCGDAGDSDTKTITVHVKGKKWDVGDAISVAGNMTSDVSRQTSTEGVPTLFVQEGQEVNLSIASGSDSDHWTLGAEQGTDADTVSYQWDVTSFGQKGALSNPTGTSTKWIVPAVVGDYDGMQVTVKCTVDDEPKALGANEDGTRDDDKVEKSLDFMVVRKKWSADPAIGQHPQLDANGNFDIHNITWVPDGKIISPAPQNTPLRVLSGATVGLEVGEAHDWDGWTQGGLDFGGGEDAPLTYRWTAGKGHFRVTDAQGNTTEAQSVSGRTATWVAPDDIQSDTDVEIKCTIDDPEGPRVGAKEAGTRDDGALERTVSVKVVLLQVTFEDQLARACAGGVAVDGVHDFTITGTAKLPNGAVAPAGTEFKLVFEGNKGHDYSGDDPALWPKANWTTEDMRKAKFVTVDANDNQKLVEELMVTTDENGEFPVHVLSSDIISSDIKIKVKSVSDDGGETEVGEKECDFAGALSLRRFGLIKFPEESDTGWLFGGVTSPLSNSNSEEIIAPSGVTLAKVYIKFRVDTTIAIDSNYFNLNGSPRRPLSDDGNWQFVNGHKLRIQIAEVIPHDGVEFSGTTSDYATLINSTDQPANSVEVVTAGDGAAQVKIQAGPMIRDAKEIILAYEDETAN